MKNQKEFVESCIKSYKDYVMSLVLDKLEGEWNKERVARSRHIVAFLQVSLMGYGFLSLDDVIEIKKHAEERAKAGHISFDD